MVSPLTALDDGLLFARARTGDGDALTCLVDRYKDPLVNYLTRISGSREQAEDIAQDTFLRLLERSRGYVEQGMLRSYLYRIATNLVRSQQRRNQRWHLLRPKLVSSNGTRVEAAQQAAVERRELGEILSRCLGEVPLKYRLPLVLRDIEEWSYADIARALDCKQGTVKSRIHRGRERLRKLVAPHWNGASR